MASSSRNYGHGDDKMRNDEELTRAAAIRELEKARVRECQMEKTVRWWTACTAGWRNKWSKLRQENEDLRKQIKGFKSQINNITQDCSTLTNKIDYFENQNSLMRTELKRLFTKYSDEDDEHIKEILTNIPEIKTTSSKCPECLQHKNEAKLIEKPITTPDIDNPVLSDVALKYPLLENCESDIKKMELLTDMVSKIFNELQTLQAKYSQSNETIDMKDLSEFPINREQLYHLQLYNLTKKLELERKDKKDLSHKLELANTNLAILNEKIQEINSDGFMMDPDLKIPIESLSLSDDE